MVKGELQGLKRLYNELSTIHELSNILTSTLCLEEVLKKTAEMAKEILGVMGCHILLLHNVHEELKLETAAYFGAHQLPQGIDFTKSGISAEAINQKKTVIVDDAENDPRTIKAVVRQVKPKSLLSVPIIFREEVLGVITVAHSQKSYFKESHAQFLNSLANQAAIAILNARLFKQMEEMANTDGLTGLYNHRYFHTALEEQFVWLAQGPGRKLAILMMDLDNFKAYNDTYGHPAGDALLRDFAQLLQKMTSRKDIAARYGGDEFALILPGYGPDEGWDLAMRISEASANFVFAKTGVSVSIGLATYPEITDKNGLIKTADSNLYRTKAGKKKVCNN